MRLVHVHFTHVPPLLLLLLCQEEHAKEFIKERFETQLLELKVGTPPVPCPCRNTVLADLPMQPLCHDTQHTCSTHAAQHWT